MNNGPGPQRSVALRSVTPDDAELILKIYASTRADELAMVTWWSDEQKLDFVRLQSQAQHDHYRNTYPQAQYLIITIEDRPAGRLYVVELETEIRILDITLLPQDRNLGSGTYLLKKLAAEAAAKNKALGIHVESFNPALRLLERLQFEKVQENGIYFLMQRLPASGTSQTSD